MMELTGTDTIRVFLGPIIESNVKEYQMSEKPSEVNINIKSAPDGSLDVKVSTDEEDKDKKESAGSKKMRLCD